MPVLLKPDENNPFSTIEIENLVTDVKERLCLRNQEMLYQHCQQRRYLSSSGGSDFCCHDHLVTESFGSLMKTNSLQNNQVVEDVHSKRAFKKRSSYIHHVPYEKQTFLERDLKLKAKKDKQSKFEDPQLLLQKLLSEQSLIQEAVRRLNFQKSKPLFQIHDILSPRSAAESQPQRSRHVSFNSKDDHP